MENGMRRGNVGRQDNVQILDITNHLHTLIRVGYAPVSPNGHHLAATRAEKKCDSKRRVYSSKRFLMNEETVWRRWRAKMHYDGRQRDEDEDTTDSSNYHGPAARRRDVGFSYGELQVASSSSMRKRHPKHSSSNVNMMNYNGTYNGVMVAQKTPSMNNDSVNNYDNVSVGCSKKFMGKVFKDYCDHCTIHGLKYVGDNNLPYMERIFWIFSFLVAISGAGFFIWHLYSKFSQSPIIISRSSITVPINQFPFPAMTVCNMNNAKKSVASEILQKKDSLQTFFLEDICNFQTETADDQYKIQTEAGEWDKIYKFILTASQDCEEMLHYCEWHTNSTNCSEIFNPVLTDEGLCCRFNSVPRPALYYDPRTWENLPLSYASESHIDWTPEYKFKPTDSPDTIPWRAHGSGTGYGLMLVLDVNADEYYCSSTASVGFKMLLHNPVETPQIKDFAFTVSPGKETWVIITPHITDAEDQIKKIPPKVRQCYFIEEKKLRYYRTYTERNCVLECEANFTMQLCDCMQYYMPVTNVTRICGKIDDPCANNARNLMKNSLYEDDDNNNDVEVPSCKCYPGCYEINYSTEISQSMLMTTFDVPPKYFKNNATYFEKNMAIVHIYFVDSSYMKYTKNELYGFAELLSNTGGLLGLFMGFSLLSVTEMLYYVVIRLVWRILSKKMQKNSKNNFINQVVFKRHDTVYPFAQ